jgi:RsiW-degrading membrane proteinase PrsW (M82 family)/RNA polymerase subunit RPABC4/transcription elongation factor Spt4
MSDTERAAVEDPTGAQPPTEECLTCHSIVPVGTFCGACGGHLPEGERRGHQSFAAQPDESVRQLSLLSTLFPYLPHRSLSAFRIALVLATLFLIVFGALKLTAAALIGGALTLPVLYALYGYEVGVYEDQPWLVTAATYLTGAVLGFLWTAFVAPLVVQAIVLESSGDASLWRILVAGIVVPATELVLVLVGPAALYVRGHFTNSLDGFTFGVASALGFGSATILTGLPAQLAEGPFASGDALAFTLEIIRRAILAPIVLGSITGVIGASLWLRRQPAGTNRRGQLVAPSTAIAVALVAQTALGLLVLVTIDTRWQLAIYGVAATILLILVRRLLHEMLLAEAQAVTIGPPVACPHCGRVTPDMPFCPNCGISRRAMPKLTR